MDVPPDAVGERVPAELLFEEEPRLPNPEGARRVVWPADPIEVTALLHSLAGQGSLNISDLLLYAEGAPEIVIRGPIMLDTERRRRRLMLHVTVQTTFLEDMERTEPAHDAENSAEGATGTSASSTATATATDGEGRRRQCEGHCTYA